MIQPSFDFNLAGGPVFGVHYSAALGEFQIEVDVPEDVPFFGIPKGKIDIQRLFYWHFLKAYYRPDWTVEELNHINFDWYRPSNCWRQTPEDVESWCVESGMKI